MEQWGSWAVSAIGILGFYLAGKKIWWAWYVNIANQVLWFVFAVVTQQWGFLLATFFYMAIFTRNAYLWTRDRNKKAQKFVADDKFFEDFDIDYNHVEVRPLD